LFSYQNQIERNHLLYFIAITINAIFYRRKISKRKRFEDDSFMLKDLVDSDKALYKSINLIHSYN
jgi:hypothetical protein